MVEDLDRYMIDEKTEDLDDSSDGEDNDTGRDRDGLMPSYIIEDNLDFKNYSHIKKPDGTDYNSIEEIINYLIYEKKALEISSQPSNESIKNKSEFSEHLENELKSLPSAVVNTYYEQANNLVELHQYIKTNKDILNRVGESFDSSIEELSDLIKDMPDNHVASLQISKSLENRIDTREEIFKLDVNEEYIKNIKELQDRIKNLDSLMQTKAKFIEDIAYEIDLLKKKASRSVRDFLLKLIIGLRKPRTNIQILQQSKLFKYSPLNQFIYHNSPSSAVEIKNLYIETVSRTFHNYFKNYLTNLTKVFHQVTLKSDVIGYLEQVKGYFGASTKSVELNKASAFNLYISGLPSDIWTSIKSEVITQIPDKLSRIDILERCLDAPLIIPHAAIRNNKKYPFEQIYRSMNILLLDTICSEYLFNRQWFAKPLLANSPDALIPSIFDKIFQLFLDNLNSFVSFTFDCLALLLCLQINKILIQLLQDRKLWDRISCVRLYFQKIDVLIWDRFSEAFKRNIDSLKNALNSKENYPTDLRPHIYTRRFSEFYSSLCIILSTFDEPRVTAWMAVLRSSMERLLTHYSNNCFNNDTKLKSIFLINNYDIIITVFSENNISQNEEGFLKFSTLLQEQINIFVELLLYSYYKNLILFIKDTEFSISNTANYQIDRNQLLALINEFSQKWKEILQKIQTEIMLNFSNFNLGSTITKQIISQYLIYYKRFEEIYKKYIKQSSSTPELINQQQQLRSSFIPVSTITFEIGKSYNNNKDLI
ncbi:hypothetical protein DICPUDRAFT_50009 [Dictyostelium purpureum]|uniref:Vps52/Sac2 family protein n=1 Tax=Dictyostelium purpureum TaxID=5786 RepID=F0ZWE9_DICPU|nr:uncharacterized protein DICPUDRAFT_50009 [Dictyostelium purpureum]EGC31732.1 hypothetical protein DICPUDRAFT_50009 [Dictyostelium purpureum]|eukprot:XP_003291739.1 hypothetical protein DICPUDRAFT_50009 [Dictyostelium purpureum]